LSRHYLVDSLSEVIESTGPVTITGNYKVLSIVIGFPDRPNGPNGTWVLPLFYPASNGEPIYGSFPNGNLLNDMLPYSKVSWYEQAAEYFFQTMSGGMFTIDNEYPTPPGGNPPFYLTQTPMDGPNGWKARFNQQTNIIAGHYLGQNNWEIIVKEVTDQMYVNDPAIFNNVKKIEYIFLGITNSEFESGNAYAFTSTTFHSIYAPGTGQLLATVIWSCARAFGAMCHELLHRIGHFVSNPPPNGFIGLPDRGYSRTYEFYEDFHHNITLHHDVMYHDGIVPSINSLYGLPNMLAHDKLFMNWINRSTELKILPYNNNGIGIKLADNMYPLTPDQINNGFCRVLKVMIHEDFSGDMDEYFLIEFKNGSEFDRQFNNFYEAEIHKGLSITHIKEYVNGLNIISDNYIDLELSVPYNGSEGNPVPNDEYPRDLSPRHLHFNGNEHYQYDWLDDNYIEFPPTFTVMPDGGFHVWELYREPPFSWDPTGEG